MTGFMHALMPNLIGAISFVFLFGSGHQLDLGTVMELINLFYWISSSFSKLMAIRYDLLNYQVYLDRI